MRQCMYPQQSASSAEGLAESLSKREIEVLRLLATGRSNNETAKALVIAESTVKMHLKHLYGKLVVHNRVQAAKRAQALRLLL
jgi:LuxR family transcriptional regulator, maltose regulon positive regulatory protein